MIRIGRTESGYDGEEKNDESERSKDSNLQLDFLSNCGIGNDKNRIRHVARDGQKRSELFLQRRLVVNVVVVGL
jgi:hypothetical protein